MNSSISQMKSTKAITLTFAILGSVASLCLFVAGIIYSGLHGLCVSARQIFSASQASCSNDPGPALMLGGALALVISIILFVYVSKINREIDYAIRADRLAGEKQ